MRYSDERSLRPESRKSTSRNKARQKHRRSGHYSGGKPPGTGNNNDDEEISIWEWIGYGVSIGFLALVIIGFILPGDDSTSSSDSKGGEVAEDEQDGRTGSDEEAMARKAANAIGIPVAEYKARVACKDRVFENVPTDIYVNFPHKSTSVGENHWIIIGEHGDVYGDPNARAYSCEVERIGDDEWNFRRVAWTADLARASGSYREVCDKVADLEQTARSTGLYQESGVSDLFSLWDSVCR